MKVLINASVLQSEGGVGLLLGLLNEIAERRTDLEVLLYLNPTLTRRMDAAEQRNPNLSVVAFHPGGGLERFFWEQVSLPRLCHREGVDLLLSFANTGPLFPGCEQVLYVQQSIPYSDYVPEHHAWRWRRIQWLFLLTMGLAQLGSTRIIVPTRWLVEPMQRSVMHRLPASTYCVSPPGLPPEPLPALASLAYSEQARREANLLLQLREVKANREFILFYPCFLAPYKHLPYLLEAAAQLASEGRAFRLVLTFDRDSSEYFPCKAEILALIQRLNLQRVILAGALSRVTIEQVYALSDALVFPSLVETLGLPMMEAMRHGLPIIATRTPFAEEVCGDAAVYTDPKDPQTMAEQIRGLMESPEQCATLGQAGRERLSGFEWAAHLSVILGDDGTPEGAQAQ